MKKVNLADFVLPVRSHQIHTDLVIITYFENPNIGIPPFYNHKGDCHKKENENYLSE